MSLIVYILAGAEQNFMVRKALLRPEGVPSAAYQIEMASNRGLGVS